MTLESIEDMLRGAGIDEAKTETYLLAEHFLNIPKVKLIIMRGEKIEDISDSEKVGELNRALKRRINREPLAYILGTAYFMNEVYEVSPHCLIPRPETELIVEEAKRLIRKNGRMLDLCTGSGCIAISTLALRHDITADAVDISECALSLAKKNAERNGVSDRFNAYLDDIFKWNTDKKYDLITANPPYITSDEMKTLDPELTFEPEIALTDGGDGLSFVRELCSRYIGMLNDGGALLCEIGADEGRAAVSIAKENGYHGEIIRDLANHDRILKITV